MAPRQPGLPPLGDGVPFADPAWYQGHASPYYTASHAAFRDRCRAWAESVKPRAEEWLEKGASYPRELHREAYDAGIAGAIFPQEYDGTPPEGFDAFHEVIMWDELARIGVPGVMGGLAINSMALPPVLEHGSDAMRREVAPAVIRGEKFICLAISEPTAGSDVSAIRASAVRSEDGASFVINGQKKWISNGLWASWFVMAVRTGGPGMAGISLVLVPADTPGLHVRKLETQAADTSNTTFVTLDDVRVPLSNMIGEEGRGFRYIVTNFNHERLVLSVQATRCARLCLEEATRHALRRKTFGKRLVEHQVIRAKIATMARLIESSWDMVESLAYQIASGVPDAELGGRAALCKVQSTLTFETCAREASQIFGGASVIKEGKGKVVERLYRSVRSMAIPGGSIEILDDLAVREGFKRAMLRQAPGVLNP